ncbi:MAG: cupin domain-containing protein [Bacteroidota bacterium]
MAKGKFLKQSELISSTNDWGILKRVCDPEVTGAKDLTVFDVTLFPDKGHAFHHHPNQEEVIYCLAGTVEQWVGTSKQILVPGDSCFIPAGMVHASFNIGEGNAKVLAILSPCIGEEGYELEEVYEEAPWKDLR